MGTAIQATGPGSGNPPVSHNNVYPLDSYTGTDDQKMASAIAAAFAAGALGAAGGTIQLAARAHTFVNQWSTTYTAGSAFALSFQGAGVAFNGMWGPPSAATTCDMQYAGAGSGRIDMQHLGSVQISGILFKDTVGSTVPFFFTTNATPYIHETVWMGNASVSGLTCYQDALVFGGTGLSSGAGDTAFFQGYGGQITRNFFDRIRSVCLFQNAANGLNVTTNAVSITCGNPALYGSPFLINAVSALSVSGIHIQDNVVEMTYYQALVNAHYANTCVFGPNSMFDSNTCINAYLDSTCTACVVDDRDFRTDGSIHPVKGAAPTTYDVLSANYGNQFRKQSIFYSTNLTRNQGIGAATENYYGDTCWWSPISYGANPAYPAAQVTAQNGTVVADAVTVSGSPVVTSATAAFHEINTGAYIRGTNIASGTFITDVFSATSWQITWQASTVYAAGAVVIPTAANTHLYQATTGGTTAGTQPTWPTGGGTVTDGGVTWQDLGTGITAALMTANASASGTGQTIFFGPGSQTAQSMTIFNNHHILGSGGTPVWTPQAAAGSGATITTVGTDLGQIITLTTAGTPTSGTLATGAAAQAAHNVSGAVAISANNAAAAALMSTGGGVYCSFAGTAPGTFTLGCVTAPGVGTYKFAILMLG